MGSNGSGQRPRSSVRYRLMGRMQAIHTNSAREATGATVTYAMIRTTPYGSGRMYDEPAQGEGTTDDIARAFRANKLAEAFVRGRRSPGMFKSSRPARTRVRTGHHREWRRDFRGLDPRVDVLQRLMDLLLNPVELDDCARARSLENHGKFDGKQANGTYSSARMRSDGRDRSARPVAGTRKILSGVH